VKTVSVSSHLTGDRLIVSETPWPIVFIETVVGHYNPLGYWDYRIWNRVLLWCDRRSRTLVEVPVPHSCDTATALWGHDTFRCWHSGN